MVFTSSRADLRWERMALAAAAASSRRSCRSRCVGLGGRVDHLAELRAVGDAPALGLVHVLAGDRVAVLCGVVPERP